MNFNGTGSYPPLEYGLHRKILFKVRNNPFIKPNLSIDSIAYCEHVGVNLQHDLNIGEINN